jgi:hypothetical protein
MAKILLELSMTLDGDVAGPDVSPGRPWGKAVSGSTNGCSRAGRQPSPEIRDRPLQQHRCADHRSSHGTRRGCRPGLRQTRWWLTCQPGRMTIAMITTTSMRLRTTWATIGAGRFGCGA